MDDHGKLCHIFKILSKSQTRREGPGSLPEDGREKTFFDFSQQQRELQALPEVHRAGSEQRQQPPPAGMIFSVKSPPPQQQGRNSVLS